jgi:hypothetical protein
MADASMTAVAMIAAGRTNMTSTKENGISTTLRMT